MDHDRISDALRAARDTGQVVIGDGALSRVAEVMQRGFGEAPAIVVADDTTWAVAGEAVHRALAAAGRELPTPHVFPGEPVLCADYENVRVLVAALRDHAAVPVVVGSGTLNDLAKRSCFELQRPYMTVATAASMDGYTAFGAAITRGGYKQTMTCPAPRAVLADLAILAAAPPRMTSSGYADLLAKICAGADWIAADLLEVEAIEPRPWSLVQGPLREATGHPAELHGGDRAAMGGLIEGLIMSGLAMQVAGSSRPASGAEHQFSHLWEMEGLGRQPPGGGPPLSHGFKVGLGTVAIAALYERVLARDLGALDVEAAVAAWPAWEEAERRVRAAHTTPGLDEAAVEQSREKYVSASELRTRLGMLAERWPRLAHRLRAQLLGAGELTARLRAAGCPTTPGEIGLTAERLRSTYRRAQMIRKRFTVLDLADQAGILDACVEELFAPGGFWAGSPGGGPA
jgi:glycerol-1-phosphate dehydrogenase [NAD(P)+]